MGAGGRGVCAIYTLHMSKCVCVRSFGPARSPIHFRPSELPQHTLRGVTSE